MMLVLDIGSHCFDGGFNTVHVVGCFYWLFSPFVTEALLSLIVKT